MALFGSGADTIAKDLRKLQGKRLELARRLVEVRAEVAAFHSVSGEAILATYLADVEGTENGTAKRAQERRRIAECDCEAQDLVSAESALVRRIAKAIIDLAKARADVIRGDAKKLERELGLHNAETQRLLGLVEAHEGGGLKFIPEFTPPADHRVFGKDGEETAFGSVQLPAPRSWQLQTQIERLLAEAGAVEARGHANAGPGNASGSNLDELLRAIADPERMAPTEADVIEWLADADVRASIAWERELSSLPRFGVAEPERDVQYHLVWDASGHIDRSQSIAANQVKFTPRPIPALVTI